MYFAKKSRNAQQFLDVLFWLSTQCSIAMVVWQVTKVNLNAFTSNPHFLSYNLWWGLLRCLNPSLLVSFYRKWAWQWKVEMILVLKFFSIFAMRVGYQVRKSRHNRWKEQWIWITRTLHIFLSTYCIQLGIMGHYYWVIFIDTMTCNPNRPFNSLWYKMRSLWGSKNDP